jgi:2-polyprenyl-3-methyl-5-hydroxy-6-metoxy-1,4-benzoquinol methylase
MSGVTFENYARLASSSLSKTEKAGRYSVQAEAERLIPMDVAAKLDLKATDSLLEIGCGLGNILVPLAARVARSAGIDHPHVIAELSKRSVDVGLDLFRGNFLTVDVPGTFDKVLVYSVLHCLSDRDEVRHFADKAMALVAPNGRLLLGDIPNSDLKRRFHVSPEGMTFQKEWQERLDVSRSTASPVPLIEKDTATATFGDASILDLIRHFRERGHDAYVLPQPAELPFGHTREDILVLRRGV